ncbi:MAG: SpoIIE family protein phosphatase [Anaerolineales bacterium]|nr:SpoIIE family protein phosphatase [Anaerolineales bacterium]
MNTMPDKELEHILIVDDNPNNLRLVSEMLRERGYLLRAVASGKRALASIELDPPEMILLDIRMPEMDGYQVCQQIKANPRTKDIPVIFISALDEIQDKMKAFEAGGVDYVTKPFQLEEVIARVETHLSLRRLQRNLEESNQRMQRELALAARVQSSIMRQHLPELPGWQTAVKLLPAKLICGDFFDVARLPNGNVAILIADVVDKGVGAALYMSMSMALLRSYIIEHPQNPGLVFQATNHRILEDTQADQFVTVFLGILNPETGALVYSNAGHNPPLLVSHDPARPLELLKHTGTALGILEEMSWTQQQIRLSPGDSLVLYTDGITEAENTGQDFYGLDRLVEMVNSLRGQPAQAVLEAILENLQQFTGEMAQSDDIALVILGRNLA